MNEANESHNDVWEDRAEEMEKKCRWIPLAVLLWGPGENSEKYWKREQIKEEIESSFPNVDVKMPENMDGTFPKNSDLDTEVDKGLRFAMWADIIIVLNATAGPLSEIDYYGNRINIAKKMFILTPKEHEGGFPDMVGEILKTDRGYHFTHKEFEECHIATETSPQYVKSKLYEKMANGVV